METKSTETSFKKILSDYENLELKIDKIEETLKSLRKEKNSLQTIIINSLDEKGLKGKSINLGTSKIIYEDKITSTGLSQSLIKKALDEYFIQQYAGKYGDDKALLKSKELFNFILKSRSEKINPSLSIKFTPS